MRFYLTLALCLLIPNFAAAQQEHSHGLLPSVPAVVSLAIFPESLPEAGKPIRVVVQLTFKGKPLEADDLKVVHTKKIHLLIVDPTLADYQHVHPEPTATPGSYLFTFTPKFSGGYRAWVDVTLMNGKQQFAMANLGKPKKTAIDTAETHITYPSYESAPGVSVTYQAGLSFDRQPAVGQESMATVTLTELNGTPVTTLEPVMGAFAHLVGFYEDYETVLHAHPVGPGPKNDTERGGPNLMFHLKPEKPGFIKLFVQVKINGKDVFVPFGIRVSP